MSDTGAFLITYLKTMSAVISGCCLVAVLYFGTAEAIAMFGLGAGLTLIGFLFLVALESLA